MHSNVHKKDDVCFRVVHMVTIYKNVIFLYYRKRNGQNYPKSLFLNAFIPAFINAEISFLQIKDFGVP